MSREEGPIVIRSFAGGDYPAFRRTLAACGEYIVDITRVTSLLQGRPVWSIKAPHMRPLQPSSFPRAGVPLPLEAPWSVEWKTTSGMMVRTLGEGGRGVEAMWEQRADPSTQRWSILRKGADATFVACHEPAGRRCVHAAFTLEQAGCYTIRVTGDGFFDYWMIDPTHSPLPIRLQEGDEWKVGSGWGFVRLEHGRETMYGAPRQEWDRG